MNIIDMEFCMNFMMGSDRDPIFLKDSGNIGGLIFKYYYKWLYNSVVIAPCSYVPWKRIPRKTKKRLDREERLRLPRKEMDIINGWLLKDPSHVEHFEDLGNPQFVTSLLAEHEKYEEESEMKSWKTLQDQIPELRSINYDGTHNAEYATEPPN
jgi:hypothetical protein